VDISGHGAPEHIVQAAVDRWGRIDALVNNAGVLALMPLAGATADGINRVLLRRIDRPAAFHNRPVRVAHTRLRSSQHSSQGPSS
jgi:NAD(P)-dependent dehydrogenase (short-subunit alcohol dehydrogenase family)